jgi:chorismate dehydratase
MSIVIGSVPYLNARPLVNWFYTDEGKKTGIEVIERPPSELAKLLESDEIDAALVSSFEYFLHPEYSIVPAISISGQDEIRSVRAFSRLPFQKIESCAMDSSSLTSVAMLSILLAEIYGNFPQRIAHRPDLNEMLTVADAALLIGDPGMLADGAGLQVLDLGQAWRKRFDLPFVYALWLGKREKISEELVAALSAAKAYGLTQYSELASSEAIRLGADYETCLSYFTEVMDYDLTDQHLEALSLFQRKCLEYALIPSHAKKI